MYHPKHVEQFPDINKLCNVASSWIYDYIGILLGAHPVLHVSRIRVNGGYNMFLHHLLNGCHSLQDKIIRFPPRGVTFLKIAVVSNIKKLNDIKRMRIKR